VLAAGRVKLVELDLFVSDRFVVSIRQEGASSGGSQSPGFVSMSGVDETLERIRAGRVRPSTSTDRFHAIVSLIALRERLLVQDVAMRVAGVERRVLERSLTDPEAGLEDMFRRVHTMTDSEQEFLVGVIDLYRVPAPTRR
jgi:hypothetical protein